VGRRQEVLVIQALALDFVERTTDLPPIYVPVVTRVGGSIAFPACRAGGKGAAPTGGPASDAAYAAGETQKNASPTAVLQHCMARRNIWATSSACTWCSSSMPKLGTGTVRPWASQVKTTGFLQANGFTGSWPGPTMWPGLTVVAGQSPAGPRRGGNPRWPLC